MKLLRRMLCVCAVILSAGVIAADGAKAPEEKPTEGETAALKACEKSCDDADGMCGSEVRRASAECSKDAANAGRAPFSQYRPYDYSYFCGYFNYSGRCADPYRRAGCKARFVNHYHACLDAMRYNIAAMRYDCFENERDATAVCRDELRQCKAACRQ
jgi:hypothetical protein